MSDPIDPIVVNDTHTWIGGVTGAIGAATTAILAYLRSQSQKKQMTTALHSVNASIAAMRTHIDARLDKQDTKLDTMGVDLAERHREHSILEEKFAALSKELDGVRKRLHDLTSTYTAVAGDLRELLGRFGKKPSAPLVPPSSDSGIIE